MYLIDGVQVDKEDFILPVENIGVWRGDGIFEAIRIHEGYPFGIDLHIERFKKSASKVFFDDINFEKIKKDILLVAENFQSGYVRTLILRNEKDSFNVFCFYNPFRSTNLSGFIFSILRTVNNSSSWNSYSKA